MFNVFVLIDSDIPTRLFTSLANNRTSAYTTNPRHAEQRLGLEGITIMDRSQGSRRKAHRQSKGSKREEQLLPHSRLKLSTLPPRHHKLSRSIKQLFALHTALLVDGLNCFHYIKENVFHSHVFKLILTLLSLFILSIMLILQVTIFIISKVCSTIPKLYFTAHETTLIS